MHGDKSSKGMKNPRQNVRGQHIYGDALSGHRSPQVLGTSRLLPARKLIRNKEHSLRTKNTPITEKKLFSNSDRKPRRNILSLVPGTVSLLSLHQENYYREYSLYRSLEHCIPFLYQLENPIKNIAL